MTMNVGFPLVLLILIVVGVELARHPERAQRARILRRAGFGLMVVFSSFFAAFVVGETFSDPGGWNAAALVVAWALPLLAFVALCWYRPALAVVVGSALVAGVVGMSAWFAASPHGWQAFENRNGPVRTIVVFVLSAGVAVLGLKRTSIAGVMLLVLGAVPWLVSSLGSDVGLATLGVASSPACIAGALYLASATMAGTTRPSSVPSPPAGTASP
jgi:hypothetical protein